MSWRAKDEPPALRSGLLKICAGVVEEATAEPYLSAVEAARQAVAASNDDMTPQQRVSLGHAQPHQPQTASGGAGVLHPSASHREKAILHGSQAFLPNAD